jgi:HEXXH motif-containing protein
MLPGSTGSRTRAVPAEPGRPTGYWRPVRQLTGAPEVAIGLDDLHPYRHGHHAPPTGRLSEPEFDRWQELFGAAWRLLGQWLPERAGELRTGLRTLVPLAQVDGGAAKSATIRHAFGVFGLTRPPDPAQFAVTLVHEFQHSKLSALLDLVPLSDPADQRRYFAPWRTDPRPLAGLIQGVYAFVGVADTWRALCHAPGDFDAPARFAYARLQVDRGLSTVEESGALTPAGRALAAGLRRTTDELFAQPVPAAAARAAQQALEQTRRSWLARNGDAA